jgi:hypothetical protein
MASQPEEELFHIIFVEDDLDWMAEDAGVSMEVAIERVRENAKYIRDAAIERINEQLHDVVATGSL